MDQLVREVHAQPRQHDVERIYVPGEWEYQLAERSRRDGVPLPQTGVRELDSLARRLEIVPLSERMHAARSAGRWRKDRSENDERDIL
jgi:LDH2 family malate/lactate/ureidoglycolate dehydrogenase